MVQTLQKIVWKFFRKLKMEIPYNLVICNWVFTSKMKTLSLKDICTPTLIAASCTIAKIWKQPKCPSIAEWIKKRWCK